MRGGAEAIEAAFRTQLGSFVLDAAFTAPAAGVTALFGPSGSGKTTILRCIAGLERAARGRCVVAGQVWQDPTTFVPTHRRPIGYVFQEASLFAHLSVRDNLRFGAPGRRPVRADDPAIVLLGLADLLDRAPRHLSGGERQRVAIGRALLSEPRLLLMDEPLSALDARARDDILDFLERLRAAFPLPILYVSHDLEEVERLASHLVLVDAGRIIAAGPLAALQSDLSLPLTARRDAAVSLDGRVCGYEGAYGLLSVALAGAVVQVPAPRAPLGTSRRLRVAATDVSLALDPAPSTILNVLPARIVQATAASATELVAVVALGAEGDGARLLARITRRSWDKLGLAEGGRVHAQIKGVAVK